MYTQPKALLVWRNKAQLTNGSFDERHQVKHKRIDNHVLSQCIYHYTRSHIHHNRSHVQVAIHWNVRKISMNALAVVYNHVEPSSLTTRNGRDQPLTLNRNIISEKTAIIQATPKNRRISHAQRENHVRYPFLTNELRHYSIKTELYKKSKIHLALHM